MAEFKKRRMTIATRFFILFIAVMAFAEGAYFFWSGPRERSKKPQPKNVLQESFSPAQATRLKEFLESTKPEEKRTAILEKDKVYEIPEGILLQEINSKNEIVIQVEGYDENPGRRATILSSSRVPMTLKKCSKVFLKGIRFQTKKSTQPLVNLESCEEVTLENCSFEGGDEALRIRLSYGVSIRDSRFSKNEKKSISVESSENLFLSNCRFRGKDRSGYAIQAMGTERGDKFLGTIQNCTFENYRVALNLSQAEVNIFQCRIQKNRTGIYLSRLSIGKIGEKGKENVIVENGDGIFVTGSSSPKIRHNEIRNNQRKGLTIEDSSTPTVSQNTISKNNFSGVEVSSQSSPIVANNFIVDNKLDGIRILDDAGGTIEENKILRNGDHGILLKRVAKGITVKDNRIEKNKGFAIFFDGVDQKIRESIEKASNTINKNKNGSYGPAR